MNRRFLTALAILALAAVFASALPQPGFAQSNPRIGTWKLNLAKSTYSPGPPPRSQTILSEPVGQGLRGTTESIDAQGNPAKGIFGPYLFDGKSYPVTGNPAFDAVSLKQVNDSTVEQTRTKAGKVVQTTTDVISADGKTWTLTTTGVDANGQPINNVSVYDKQ